jgi:hypothetical protein
MRYLLKKWKDIVKNSKNKDPYYSTKQGYQLEVVNTLCYNCLLDQDRKRLNVFLLKASC